MVEHVRGILPSDPSQHKLEMYKEKRNRSIRYWFDKIFCLEIDAGGHLLPGPNHACFLQTWYFEN